MGAVATDLGRVKTFVDKCIESLENGNYAHICAGYSAGSSGSKFDGIIQSHADKIVNKLVSLGYSYTTNHGFGCKDWSFYKEIEL